MEEQARELPASAESTPSHSRSGTTEPRRKDHFVRMMLFEPRELEGTRARTEPPPELPTRHEYRPLAQSPLPTDAGYHVPDPTMATHVTMDSAAIEVMTDLRRVMPVTIGRFCQIAEANQTMIAHSVRSLFVVDGSRLLGIVTATDILGEKPVQITHQRGIRHDEVIVRDIMTPVDHLEAVDLADVLEARVGDIYATLKRAGRQHALAIDRVPDGPQRVRGIFSLTQIARQLGITPSTPEIGRTFAEIEAALRI